MSKNAEPVRFADPVKFAEEVLGAQLWDTQKEILYVIENERRVAVKAAHASGKTYAAAVAALRFAARHRRSRVIVLAPGWQTVKTVLWSQIHSLIASAPHRLPTTQVNMTELRIGVDNLIIGLSTNEATRLQGHHADHLLIIADEATGIAPEFWASIEGILAGGDSHLLLLGNPTSTNGYFYDAFGRNRGAWRTFTISAFDTPNLEGVSLEQLLKMSDAELDTNIAPYLTTRRWTAERHREWYNGSIENSPLWASRVLGEFPASATNALVPLAQLEAACRTAVDPGGRVIIGCDPAGPGRDSTACVAVAGGAILDHATFNDADARGPVLHFIKKWADRLQIVKVDSGGIGFYFTEHLRSQGYRVEGVNAASAPRERERFTNLKAERYFYLRQAFQRGQVSGLDDETLAELASINYAVDAHGKICIEDKASVKSALGHSPDRAESLMLALGELPPQKYEYIPAPTPPRRGFDYVPPESNPLDMKGRDWSRQMDQAEFKEKYSPRRKWRSF